MLESILLIFIAGIILVISLSRFVTAVRKLAAGEHDTRGHEVPTRQDKPPLVFWSITSAIIVTACVLLLFVTF